MKLGITLGDPAGVGPEIVLKAYRDGDLKWPCVVIGDLVVLEACRDWLGYDVRLAKADAGGDGLPVLDLGILSREELVRGAVSKACGRAANLYLQRGIREALEKRIDAIVTLPMNKEATRLTVPGFTGHTQVIAAACGCRDYSMTLISDRLIVAHVSTHVSLREAIDTLCAERVLNVIRLTHGAAARLGRPTRIAVMGLNPHAGEEGAFGDEETLHILPAVRRAKEEGLDVMGPLPPDTVFMRAQKGDFGAIVCMYHDQGHIAMKTLGFHDTVNVTIGLPFVRTSVDHGTAFDIAYTGQAQTGSFLKACELAVKLA